MNGHVVEPALLYVGPQYSGPCIGGPMCGRELHSTVRSVFALWPADMPVYYENPSVAVRRGRMHAQYLFSDGIWFHARNL